MIPGCVERCPGCRYRGLSPEESDRRKSAWVASNLAALEVHPLPLRAPLHRWGYRRKALLHAKLGPEGWAFGLLRRSRENPREAEHVAIPSCPLHEPALNDRLQVLRTLIPASAPLAFVLATGSILTLVLKTAANELDRHWARVAGAAPLRAAGVESLQINWNPAAGRRALSSRHQEVIYGPALVEESGLFHGAQSFRQQIPELEEEALRTAENFLEGAGIPAVVDLYSGVGASLRRWASHRWSAIGVEITGDACAAAALNVPSAPLLKGKVEDRLPQLVDFVQNRDFVLYTNPPREGHSMVVLDWIRRSRPVRIAYLSCNARTLSLDMAELRSLYSGETVQPFDFFPQTDHVECLALLSLRK